MVSVVDLGNGYFRVKGRPHETLDVVREHTKQGTTIQSISEDNSYMVVLLHGYLPNSHDIQYDWNPENKDHECQIAGQYGVISSRVATYTQLLLGYLVSEARKGSKEVTLKLDDFHLSQYEIMEHALSQNITINMVTE